MIDIIFFLIAMMLDGNLASFFIIAVVALLIIGYMKKKKGNTKRQRGPLPEGAKPTKNLQPLSSLLSRDEHFSEDAIKQRLSNLYVQMQNAWSARDLTPLRGDFTDAQFEQYERQVQKYRDDRLIPRVERIAVLDVQIRGVKQSEQHDILIVNLRTRITTYTTKEDGQQIVWGSRNEEKFMEYEWTLVRPKGSKTLSTDKDQAFNCPNCSAPMRINQSAQCPYCHSVVSKAQYDWVIAGIKGLSQRTV